MPDYAVTVSVEFAVITNVTLKTSPTKTVYTVGDELDVTGAVLTVEYADGTSSEIPVTSKMVTGFDKDTLGEQTVTVTYNEKTVTFTVNVQEPKQEPDVALWVTIILVFLLVAMVAAYFVMYLIWKKSGKAPAFLVSSFEDFYEMTAKK
ncbi:MAG: bacterial Ig-like domain-containing protein [Clostridia bacterium]|nr:bacterial Ig-like domain-containing protein [Clostridia bacterium]